MDDGLKLKGVAGKNAQIADSEAVGAGCIGQFVTEKPEKCPIRTSQAEVFTEIVR